MPSTQEKTEINLKQLIPPKPTPIRGKSFPLSGNEEWLIYPHGKTVYLYNLKDHSLNKEYLEHAYSVGVARLSPSGCLVASGDQCGNLRIFNLADLSTKLEIKVLGGMINDLAWSDDEKFIAVSGEGREQFASVIKVEGGDAVAYGELTGPSKPCPTISLHSTLCILGSDDKSLTIYRAAPKFKFIKTLRDHEGFVQVARFNPDGTRFATAGADGRVFIYSSETFEVIQNGCKLHEAGILALEWIDNETLITASADKSLKLWNSTTATVLKASQVSSEWTFEQQICGILVQKDSLIVLRLNGSFECRDKKTLELLKDNTFRSIGHSKGVVDLSCTAKNVLSSVSYDGTLKTWTFSASSALTWETENYFKNAQKLVENWIIFENKMIDCSDAKNIREFPSKIVAVKDKFVILSDGKIVGTHGPTENFSFESSIDLAAFNETGNILAVASGNNLKFYEFSCIGDKLEIKLLQLFDDLTSRITCLSFSKDKDHLAVADEQRRIKIYSRSEREWKRESSQWCNHSARIDSLLWITSRIILSAGVDGHIMAWSLDCSKVSPMFTIKAAHSAPISKLQKVEENEKEILFASGATDSSIKIYEMRH